MKMRRVLFAIASVALAAVLIILIIRIGNIDLHSTWHEIEGARPAALVGLVLLNVLLIYLSTEKWRSVDAALRHTSDPVPQGLPPSASPAPAWRWGRSCPSRLE